jgi:2-dehydro-3-deoxy-D-gluconate 5-dehydrogenase
MSGAERPRRLRSTSPRGVIVTGASRGIGRAVALRFGAEGDDLALIQRGEAADTVQALGRAAIVERCDLADAEAAEHAVARAIEQLGRVDVCICNAGAVIRESALDISIQDFRRVVELNLVSTFAVARAAAREMKAGGSIVMTASVLGFQGGWRVSSYAASKSGVVNLVRALANEWASLGIRVNGVAPGYVANELTSALLGDPERSAQLESRIPAGRWGSDEDVAGAVAWLASPAAAYVHGHTLVVDGGWLGR